ncbi:MAG: hypothetical protein OQK56_02500 [Ignavibacteriaceae bacterium]|nr:hypothetical protein [Ignavibacteriaceae bacterium]
MDKKKSLDLIKLEVLGCLNDKDKESLQAMKTESEEFPWKVLGDYQNLIAHLPLALELKYPASDIKDKTATKLYNIRDQIKAKVEAKKALEIPAQPVEEEIFESEGNIDLKENFEENVTTEQIEVEEKVFAEVEEGMQLNADETIAGQDEPVKFPSKFKENSEPENLFPQASEFEAKEPSKAVIDKNVVEKIARDYIKTQLDRQIESLSKTVNKNRILSFILFIISLLLILTLYFIK